MCLAPTPTVKVKRRTPDMRRLGDHLDGAKLGPDGVEVVKVARGEGESVSVSHFLSRGSAKNK